jgi:hypothetical protein
MKTKVTLVVLAVVLLSACGSVKTESGGYASSIGNSGCTFDTASMRGEWDFNVAISGPRQNTAVVDVTLPGDGKPLPVLRQIPKKFIDTEELYVHQIYDYDVQWRTGRYTLSVVNGAKRGTASFLINQEANWVLYVHCK